MPVGAGKVNPDLAEERAAASFPVEELSVVLYGGREALERRRYIAGLVEGEPDFQDRPSPPVFLGRKARYENAMRKAVAMARYGEKLETDNIGEIAYFESLVMAGETAPMALHYTMFLPAIQGQATEEQQEKWFPKAWTRSIIGTYAQTELGHGTNLRKLETTATFDPARDEFVMNTPSLTATKWWPGNLGKSSNHAVVYAQLYTRGKCHGPHGFIVQLRDERTHQPLPGVKVGDIGPKFGMNSNDNGYLAFDHVRIPRENMLMKNSKVLKDGTFVPPNHGKLTYGAMVFVRSVMIANQGQALAKAATIAVRYSSVRRQGEMTPGAGEVKVLDYQTQQYRVLPELAKAYAFYFAGQRLRELHAKVTEQLKSGDTALLPELHVMSSGLKAYVSWEVAQGIEQCRLACGGHGYMQASGFPELYGLTVGGCTYEGDNIVMLLQVARGLVKAVRNRGGQTSDLMRYLVRDGGPPPSQRSGLSQNLEEAEIVRLLEHAARRQARAAVAQLDQLQQRGYSPADAWNRTSVQLCKASRAHVRLFVTRMFMEKVGTVEHPAARSVLGDVSRLYALHTLHGKAHQFLEDGFLSRQQLLYIREGLYSVLARVRVNAVALADAWDFRDRELRSVLGRYDGNVYENLVEWTKHSTLNEADVLDCHRKYLGPMMQEARSKL